MKKQLSYLVFLALVLQAQLASAAPYYRFWRGWKIESLSSQAFQAGLNARLLPMTVGVGGGKGLVGYLPFLYPENNGTLPDEVALVIYQDEPSYQAIRSTPEGKAYGDLHWEFFDKARGSGSLVPEPYAGRIENQKAYDVLQSDADWRQGHAVFVTSRIAGDLRPYVESMRARMSMVGLRSYVFLVQGNVMYEYQLWNHPASFRKHWMALRQSQGRSVIHWSEGSGEMGRSDWRRPHLQPGRGLNMIF
jgi:hypothetical protein